jgi:hypothetical protein
MKKKNSKTPLLGEKIDNCVCFSSYSSYGCVRPIAVFHAKTKMFLYLTEVLLENLNKY